MDDPKHEFYSPEITSKRLFTIRETCSALGCSRSHLYSLEKRGLVRFGKLLGKTVVTAAEIDRLVSAVERGEVA